MKRAIFIDKDGTLITDVAYNVDPKKITFALGFGTLKKVYDAGFQLIVVSNQSGIARGFFSEQALLKVKKHLQTQCQKNGFGLTDFYYCPHHPEGRIKKYTLSCECRKPSPGLLHQAARDHQIDLSASWMMGDILNDIEAGNRAGCKTILLNNGSETRWEITENRLPHFVVKNLSEAVDIVLSEEDQQTTQTLSL